MQNIDTYLVHFFHYANEVFITRKGLVRNNYWGWLMFFGKRALQFYQNPEENICFGDTILRKIVPIQHTLKMP